MFPPRQATGDGFELQLGTNHLGPFALTGLLLEQMLPVPGSRVVTIKQPRAPLRAGSTSATCSPSGPTPGGRVQPVQAWPACCSPTSWPPAIRRGHHHRGRRPPGPRRHRADPPHPAVAAFSYALVTQNAAMGALPALRAATDPGVAAASTTARAESSGPGATRNWPHPAGNPTTPPSSTACGQSPKN